MSKTTNKFSLRGPLVHRSSVKVPFVWYWITK